MPEAVQTKRDWGTIEPDKRYDIGHVDVRFDVPLGVSYELMQVIAAPTVRKAIEQFERIGKWRHYDRIPVQYHVSAIHKPALERLNLALMMNPRELMTQPRDGIMAMAADAVQGDTVAMVARVYFIRPLVAVNMDEAKEYRESVGYEQGFMPKHLMPEGSLPNRDEH